MPLQEAEKQEPLPAGVVARLGSRDISKAEYLDFLWIRFGKRAVQDYVGVLLIEQEAATYGIEIAPEVFEARVAERIQESLGGKDEAIFIAGLKRGGQSRAMYEKGLRTEMRKDLLLEKLTLATRVVTDTRIQGAFESNYGPKGVRTEVRHLLFMPNVLRAEKVRAGTRAADLDMAALKIEARSLAQDARDAIAAGADFAATAQAASHDRVSRDNGGLIAHYGGRIYGPVFGGTVDGLEPGALSPVIETGAGFHVVMVDSRVVTLRADVRSTLVEEILASPPSMHEKSSFLQALQSKADLQLW